MHCEFFLDDFERVFSDDPVVGVVGRWDEKGGHGNLGARLYRDRESFLHDVLADSEPVD
jgi:hypothetical protein